MRNIEIKIMKAAAVVGNSIKKEKVAPYVFLLYINFN